MAKKSKAGEIKVRVRVRSAIAGADWIDEQIRLLKQRPDTVLTPGYNGQRATKLERRLLPLSKALRKSARSKRGERLIAIKWPYVAMFLHDFHILRKPPSLMMKTPRAIYRLFYDMQHALRARPGRPPLKANDRLRRQTGKIHVEDRQLKRIKKKDAEAVARIVPRARSVRAIPLHEIARMDRSKLAPMETILGASR